jgi:hypothetical protein
MAGVEENEGAATAIKTMIIRALIIDCVFIV